MCIRSTHAFSAHTLSPPDHSDAEVSEILHIGQSEINPRRGPMKVGHLVDMGFRGVRIWGIAQNGRMCKVHNYMLHAQMDVVCNPCVHLCEYICNSSTQYYVSEWVCAWSLRVHVMCDATYNMRMCTSCAEVTCLTTTGYHWLSTCPFVAVY